ncbi:intercellular trafficking and secretion [Microbotryomycetes sp. JL221]|nr:intercellular trafficking and secretion [Microbotryomycetes sp. JL221]
MSSSEPNNGLEDEFGSVAWDTQPSSSAMAASHDHFSNSGLRANDANALSPTRIDSTAAHDDRTVPLSKRQTVYDVTVSDGKVELEGTNETFVSYLVQAKTESTAFANHNPSTRRRFQDFVFVRDMLVRDFPACVIPPLPDKHRMGKGAESLDPSLKSPQYVVGDRFSTEFVERRRADLQRFLERVSRHPKLSTTAIFQNFLESTEWNVYKHKQSAKPVDPDHAAGLLDNLSDTLLNAFTKVRKPDERFIELRTQLDQFEEGLTSIERLGSRSKTRLNDLAGDYEDMAMGVQGLGYLESGITDSLMRFERALVEFGSIVRDNSGTASAPFLDHVHSLLAYSAAFKSVLKLRDQKQQDFEELSQYLSNMVMERDRLANGYGYGLGLGSYLKEKVETLRGGDADSSRHARLARLETKIKELQDAVVHSQDTSQAFNDEVLSEHMIFRTIKRNEMRELLGRFAEGQISMYRASLTAWDQ